ncbi:MAG: GAF domain-containing protein [Armatimonadota bacterium]|nr:GAF domain-containing protein [bacterium]
MATEQGIRSADPHAKSLLERAVLATGEALCRRLLIWAAVLAVGVVMCRLILSSEAASLPKVASASIMVIGSIVGLAGTAYFLARFVLSWELRSVLAAVALSSMGGGAVAQVVAIYARPDVAASGLVATVTWVVSAALFAVSPRANVSCYCGNRAKAVAQSGLALLAVLIFPLLSLMLVLRDNPLTDLWYPPDSPLVSHAIRLIVAAVAFTLTIAALHGHYRHSQMSGDRISSLLCFFFVPCVLAIPVKVLASGWYDGWSSLSQVLFLFGWIALVWGFGMENAIMQKEVQDRLQELDALHHVSWSIVGARSVCELLDLFAATHIDQLGAKIASVYLADDCGSTLEVCAHRGPEDSPAPVGTKFPLFSEGQRPGFHTGHTVKAFTSGEPQIANDVFVDVEFVPWRMIAADDGCAVSLPLVDQERTIGVLNLYFSESRLLTRQRLRLLAIIATTATPAIANALSRESVTRASDVDTNFDLAA